MRMKILRAERKKRGWTLLDVSEKTGIEQGVLSRVERGLIPCWPAWKKKLSDLFEIPEDELTLDAEYELVKKTVKGLRREHHDERNKNEQ